MSKLPDFSARQQAFTLYTAGMSQSDIAKELDVAANTINTWKKRDKWDKKPTQSSSPAQELTDLPAKLAAGIPPDSKDLLDQVKLKLADAIINGQIAPRKWKDIIDTLSFLSRDWTSGDGRKKVEADITDLNDTDLDREIAELKRLGNDKDEDEAEIIVPKRDVTEIEPS